MLINGKSSSIGVRHSADHTNPKAATMMAVEIVTQN
jgi:hypothetical protein